MEYWFQKFDKAKNFSMDLNDYNNCLIVTENIDGVYNLACNMGGMGFITNNKADCMLSVLINTNLLRASKINNVVKFLYSSSACIYNTDLQEETFINVRPLFIVPRINTANNVPQTLPIPPYKLVPPNIIAAIIVKRWEPAALGAAAPNIAVRSTPAIAPLKPDKTYK